MTETRDGHEAIQELAGAAALRALTPDEARFVRAHLAGCAECRRLYAELFGVADLLLRTPDPVAPPPALRQRILDLAARTPQEPGAEASAAPATPAESLLPADAPAGGEPRPPVRAGGFERRAGGKGRQAAVQAAETARRATTAPGSHETAPRRRFDLRDLALVASLAAALFFGWTTLRLQDELAVQRTRLEQSEPLLQAVARGGRIVSIAGTERAPQVRGAVTETHLYLESLPKPPDDRVYQVWLIPPGGQPVGAGVSEPGGGGTQVIALNRPLAGMDTIAVTQEPAPSGSPGPTTPILAAARLGT